MLVGASPGWQTIRNGPDVRTRKRQKMWFSGSNVARYGAATGWIAVRRGSRSTSVQSWRSCSYGLTPETLTGSHLQVESKDSVRYLNLFVVTEWIRGKFNHNLRWPISGQLSCRSQVMLDSGYCTRSRTSWQNPCPDWFLLNVKRNSTSCDWYHFTWTCSLLITWAFYFVINA